MVLAKEVIKNCIRANITLKCKNKYKFLDKIFCFTDLIWLKIVDFWRAQCYNVYTNGDTP